MAGITTDGDDFVDSHILKLLKPFELTHSATPAELKEWADKFKTYYQYGKGYKTSLRVQNVLVGTFMDANLRSRMRGRARGKNIPIYGAARDSYKQKYPEQGSYSIEPKKVHKVTKIFPSLHHTIRIFMIEGLFSFMSTK